MARQARLRRRPRSRRRAVLASSAVVVAAILAGVLATVAFTGRTVLLDSCSLSDLRPISLGENSFLFARNGALLGVVPSKTNRQPLKLRNMSPWLPKATVAIEDRRFFEHGALDYQGIARAALSDLQAGHIVEGGSTITQELARNLYIGHSQRTFGRKVREACLAEKLAQRLTKQQILAAYLNEVFYGRHAFGAQAGAQTFFSTKAQRLTLPQAALLAGLPQAPSTYDPVLHPQRALARRDEVLRAMLDAGHITRREYVQARAAPLGIRLGKLYSRLHQPNFFGWATTQLIKRFGARRVEAGGLRVKTTLDPRLQAIAQRAARDVLKTPSDPAAALVAIDPRTGAVRAMVGYLPSGRRMQFNLATQAHRTTGSAFKPITLATAISQGVSVYSSFYGPPQLYITDPQCAGPDGPWNVHNYADEAAGTMNLLDATANSVNTIFAQLVAKVGVRNVVRMGHRLGIRSRLQQVCSITLGSQAITPLDLTTVYATFAARGVFRAPQAIALARGPQGKVIGRLETKGKRVLSLNTADLVTYALQGVIQHGTGTGANFGRPEAGKTGTAENYQDAWFCGYVPQLATCVWVGYPKAEIPLLGIEGYGSVFGGSLPASIWREFMSQAVAPLPAKSFPAPVSFGSTTISGSGTYGWSSSSSSSSSSG
jgi:penicillin-binding protein 1A